MARVIQHERACNRMKWDVSGFVNFAAHDQIGNTPALVIEVLDRESAKFLSPEGMIEQGAQNGAVSFAFQ